MAGGGGPRGGIMKVSPAASDLRDRAGTRVPRLPPGSTRLVPDLLHGLRSVVKKEGLLERSPQLPLLGEDGPAHLEYWGS